MQIQIAKSISVNPEHVISVLLNEKTFKTVIVTIGGKVESDHNLVDTIKLLNGESLIK